MADMQTFSIHSVDHYCLWCSKTELGKIPHWESTMGHRPLWVPRKGDDESQGYIRNGEGIEEIDL